MLRSLTTLRVVLFHLSVGLSRLTARQISQLHVTFYIRGLEQLSYSKWDPLLAPAASLAALTRRRAADTVFGIDMLV